MNNFDENNHAYVEAKKRVQKIKGFYIHAFVYVCINAMIIYSNAVLNHQGFVSMDNYYTAIFWGIGLLAHFMSVFIPNIFFGKEWENRKIKEFMDKNK